MSTESPTPSVSIVITDDENQQTNDSSDDEYLGIRPANELTVSLQKWTNYISGWQDRFLVLKNGIISYYKDKLDTQYGCRGSMALNQSAITAHDLDECRFDIRVNDCVWYLRALDSNERERWIKTLEEHRKYYADSSLTPATTATTSTATATGSLIRHNSILSLTSIGCTSTTSYNKAYVSSEDLKDKLAEIDTYKDILCKQIETLQVYFDACANTCGNGFEPYNHKSGYNSDSDSSDGILDEGFSPDANKPAPDGNTAAMTTPFIQEHGAMAVDFKGEALTFKATTTAILTNLAYSIDLMQQSEETWRKKYEKQIEKRKRLDERYKKMLKEKNAEIAYLTSVHLASVENAANSMNGTPDYEEGPHCSLKEEQFFDALDSTLDNLELEEDRLAESKENLKNVGIEAKTTVGGRGGLEMSKHPMSEEILRQVEYHLKYDRQDLTDIWELFSSDGELKMYRREVEENGIVLDPLKAVHTVKGVTGHEVCHYFWDPKYRLEWETTLDSTKVIEVIDENTLVFHQIHKRVWPAAQRDACFWSHMRSIQNEDDEKTPDWMVCNYSTEHEKAPIKSPFIRAIADVAMTCSTVIVNPPRDKSDINRSHLVCKISYVAQINPGGWVPAAGLRTVFKREFPRFLKRFTQYVIDSTTKKPIMF